MSRQGAVYRRTPGPVSVDAALRLWKESAVTTAGQDRNRTTGSSYNRHSGSFLLARHFILTAVLWDIFAAGTYKIAFVSDLTNAPSDLSVLNAAYVAAGGSAEETIVASPNILLTPGLYYLSILKDGAAVRMDDISTVFVRATDYLWLYNATYNGGASGSYSIPIKIVGRFATVTQALAFQPILA